MSAAHQPHLQPRMRAILFDWMMEVAQEFTLGRETLHLAFNLVDRYLRFVCAFAVSKYE